ncbi:MAG: hypothetical protein ACREPI_12665 [Candidatus Dormibacterales bacterium]
MPPSGASHPMPQTRSGLLITATRTKRAKPKAGILTAATTEAPLVSAAFELYR